MFISKTMLFAIIGVIAAIGISGYMEHTEQILYLEDQNEAIKGHLINIYQLIEALARS